MKLKKYFENDKYVILVPKDQEREAEYSEVRFKQKPTGKELEFLLSEENIKRAFDEIGFKR